MKRAWLAILLGACAANAAEPPSFWDRFRLKIETYLGRPYTWGASGVKSFDCSGFVWRVSQESGLYFKRTTARKLFFSTSPPAKDQRWRFGNLVFFDDLGHVGIVNDSRTFYHAHRTGGTTLSEFGSYWTPKITGVRTLRAP